MTSAVPTRRLPVQVSAIDLSNRTAVDRYIDLPFTLYREVPQWTPPLRGDECKRLDPQSNEFFRHSTGGFFLAEHNGVAVGRLAVLRQRFYNDVHHNDTAFFYGFECIDDQTVADALFATAEAWAHERGLRHLLGPVGFVQADPPGILVRGFEHEGTVDVPWHFPYYERLITNAGFIPHTDYLSGYFDRSMPFPDELINHGQQALIRGGYRVLNFCTRDEIAAWADQFFDTYLKAFESVPDFYAMSRAEFTDLLKRMLLIIEPSMVKGLASGDNLLGFLLTVRDITPGLRRAQGKLWPLGWWHLLSSRRQSRQCNIIALGVLPEHQKGGVNLALLGELVKAFRDSPFERAEIVQIMGGNLNTHGDMTRLGARWDKCHRVFRRVLPHTP